MLVDAIQEKNVTVAVAESLTGGLLTDTMAKLPNAGEWLRGGLVAYSADVKRDLLGIGDAHVVSEAAARAMAANVATLLGADVSVAVTGVGGPDAQDGVPAGTVWMATSVAGDVQARVFHFEGGPEQVVEATCSAAHEMLLAALGG